MQCRLFRLAVYVVQKTQGSAAGPDELAELRTCSCLLASTDPLWELWVRCSSLEDLASALESLLERASIVGLGTLAGRVVLPSLRMDLSSLALEDSVLSGSIEVELVGRDALRGLARLPVAEASIHVRRRRGTLRVRQPVSASQLFDLGLRALRPVEAPPRPATAWAALRGAWGWHRPSTA